MNTKWQQKMVELGLTKEKISHGLKNKIKDYNKLIEGIEEIKQNINNPSKGDDIEQLKIDLDELESTLESADEKLTKAIVIYDKNKEVYEKLSSKLGRGRPRKNATIDTVKDTNNGGALPIIEAEELPIEVKELPIEAEEKKSDNSWIFIALLVGVFTFGAVALNKNS